jgi:hypothetical protein
VVRVAAVVLGLPHLLVLVVQVQRYQVWLAVTQLQTVFNHRLVVAAVRLL